MCRCCLQAKCLLIVLLLLTSDVLAQEPARVLRGAWTAAADAGMTFRGNWSAQAHPDAAGAAYGSWTLVSDRNQVLLQGTWSAEKSAESWRGRWSARTLTGRSFSGTWEAAIENRKGGTVMEMLERTLKEQVAGSWRYGGLAGYWWLRGSPP